MQILMSEAGHERVRGRLATIAPDVEVVTIRAPDTFMQNGVAVEEEAVNPEIAWVTLDSYASGSARSLFGRILQAPAMRWTQSPLAGLDHPVFRNIMSKGVRLSKSSAQAVPIAEYVVGHALSLLTPIEAQAAAQRDHAWRTTSYREIGNTRWVLIGYGSIGQEIARRIKPFGVDLTVVRRSPGEKELADRTIRLADLASELPQADVVVLACPLNDETKGLAGEAFFAALKPGSILINIGRGGLVDEDALRAGLDRDQPGRAVLDVFVTEPLPTDSWFWDHPKVRVSGHTSHAGDGVQGRMDDLFLENLRRYMAGEPLLNEAHSSEVGL